MASRLPIPADTTSWSNDQPLSPLAALRQLVTRQRHRSHPSALDTASAGRPSQTPQANSTNTPPSTATDADQGRSSASLEAPSHPDRNDHGLSANASHASSNGAPWSDLRQPTIPATGTQPTPAAADPSQPICTVLEPEATLGLDSTDPLWSTTPLLDPSLTFRLHSDPTATRIIYLDFDGHTTTGTGWNTSTMGTSFTSPAYDFDGNPASFSAAELTRIQQIWQRIASDFAPFAVDVTTQAPPKDGLIRSSSSDPNYGIRVVFTSYGPYSSTAGGVSFIGSFTANSDTPAFVYNRTVIGASEAGSHETGHTLGLSHDGQGTTTYYGGHGSGETGWAPIMGASYNRSVSTWDIGQYTGTNNGSSTANYGKGPDDLAVITGTNGFGYQADLVGNTLSSATALRISGGQVNQFGTIETRQDQDFYGFDLLSSGDLNLSFDPYWMRTYVDGDGVWGGSSTAWASRMSDLYSSTSWVENGSNLDLAVTLYNGTGKILVSANPTGLGATLTLSGLAAGHYVVSLDGTGFGDPMAATPTGYTDADSLGFYRISGSITNAADSLTGMALASTDTLLQGSTDTTSTSTNNGKGHRDGITGLSLASVNAAAELAPSETSEPISIPTAPRDRLASSLLLPLGSDGSSLAELAGQPFTSTGGLVVPLGTDPWRPHGTNLATLMSGLA